MTLPLPAGEQDEQVLQLHAETLTLERRSQETGEVVVSVSTRLHDHRIDEMLTSMEAHVEHVPVGRIVDVMPEMRTEGDTIIVPVVEEVVVTRLLLREEVRITRVAATRRHQNTVSLRTEEATITRRAITPERGPAPVAIPGSNINNTSRKHVMASETIVAVFDTAAHAETAIADLVAHGVPAGSIEHYAQGGASAAPVGATTDLGEQKPRGLWAWLTGEAETTSQHHALYDQTIQSGGTVVTVISDGGNVDAIHDVLEKHNPVDLDERHSTYAASGAYGSTQIADTAVAATGTAAPLAVGASANEEVLSLSEETLAVGKRAVDRGTTRVRRYVVERPVEEQIRLRDETVSVYRRPVTAGSTVGTDAFTDREIVMTETDEEAVVAKSAHVVEEVVLQKNVEERVETVRDTLRREEVEIAGPTTTTSSSTTKPLPGV